MTIYRKQRRVNVKWLLALIIFVLAMTITFDGVEGSELSGFDSPDINQANSYTSSSTYTTESTESVSSSDRVPLLLIAGVLGVMHAVRRKRA